MEKKNDRLLCNCNEIQEKLVSLLEDNGNLLQMIRELKAENERLRNQLKRSNSGQSDPRHEATDAERNKVQIQSLIDINHGWKRDYEELEMRHEMLGGEKKLIEEEERELRQRVDELERRQAPLESEIARLAQALYEQGTCESAANKEKWDILKTQLAVYKEDFERERVDREKLHEEKEKLKSELEEAADIIKKLTSEIDRRSINRVYAVRPENGYVSIRNQPRQVVLPGSNSSPMSHDRWRYEQNRRGILPRNPPPTSFFYGGDVEVDE